MENDNNMQEGAASSAAQSPSVSAKDDAISHNEMLSPSEKTTQPTNSMISQHLNTLEHLDKQHQYLLEVEQSLQKYLDELQKEEKLLRKALVQSSATLKEQRRIESRQKEEEALARLEAALMNDDDSDGTIS